MCRANGDGFVDGLRQDGGGKVADGGGRVAGRGGGRVRELVGGNYSFIFLHYSSIGFRMSMYSLCILHYSSELQL